MKKKFEIFNDLKLKKDYENITLTDKEKTDIKKRINQRLNKDKEKSSKLFLSKAKRYALVSTIFIVVIGSIIINTNPSLAEDIESKIEELLGIDKGKLNEYKVSNDLILKDKDIEVRIKEVVLDDRKLILDIDMDYSEFEYKDANINKKNLSLDIPNISIGDVVFAGQSGSCSYYYQDLNKSSMLIEVDLFTIDTNGDMCGDEEYELLENIDPDKNYDMTIEFNGISYNDESITKTISVSEKLSTYGTWVFETSINASDIINDTKVVSINEEAKIDTDLFEGIFRVEEVRFSPIYTKVKFSFEYDIESVNYAPFLFAVYEDGEKQGLGYTGGGDKPNTLEFDGEFLLRDDVDQFKLVPAIYSDNEDMKFLYESSIEIQVP